TDCDPDLVELPIPGNDDSMRSIELVMKRLADAIVEGRASAPPEPPPRENEQASGDGRRGDRRGDRRGGGGGGGGGRGGQGNVARSGARAAGRGPEVSSPAPAENQA